MRRGVASARAGNVIGGGDWGEDRLIGDIVRAVRAGEPVQVRNPEAVRPWQHVLNPLSGYLRLAEELWRSPRGGAAWNFGPRAGDARTVRWIVERLAELWGGALQWELDEAREPARGGPSGAGLGQGGARAWAGARSGIWRRRWSGSSRGTRPSAGARTCGESRRSSSSGEPGADRAVRRVGVEPTIGAENSHTELATLSNSRSS